MSQKVYENLLLAQLENNFDEITASAYSASLFTDWQSASFNQVWLKRRVVDGSTDLDSSTFFGATPAPTHRHPIIILSAENCTAQMGIAGPWYERLPHFRMGFTPSSGEELQTEYILPRQYAIEAIQAINRLRDHVIPLLQIITSNCCCENCGWDASMT